MISIRCPHCHVGLKVDETKLPSHIQTFNCPQCRKPIPVSILNKNLNQDDSETVILSPAGPKDLKMGRIQVIGNELTPPQTIQLSEGVNIIGRKSSSSDSATTIETQDKLMSRAHIGIEIKKDAKGNYNHYLFDNKSKNRTLYNSNYIEPEEIIILKDKDEIQIGQTRLLFEVQHSS